MDRSQQIQELKSQIIWMEEDLQELKEQLKELEDND